MTPSEVLNAQVALGHVWRREGLGVCIEPPSAMALYAAVRNELGVDDIARWAHGAGHRVCYPRVTGPGQMRFIPTSSLPNTSEQWQSGAYNIPEPIGEPIEHDAIGLVLVPGTAFDHQGGRLGMGGGFYDRWLEQRLQEDAPLCCVGVCYDWQVVEQVPAQTHDHPMHYLLTPSGIVKIIDPTDR